MPLKNYYWNRFPRFYHSKATYWAYCVWAENAVLDLAWSLAELETINRLLGIYTGKVSRGIGGNIGESDRTSSDELTAYMFPPKNNL